VILSAGSIGSPHILELSGIGNSDLLSKYGINVAISNENVGENLQDHIYVPIGQVNPVLHSFSESVLIGVKL